MMGMAYNKSKSWRFLNAFFQHKHGWNALITSADHCNYGTQNDRGLQICGHVGHGSTYSFGKVGKHFAKNAIEMGQNAKTTH